jgi:3-mercaptopyruvate sulfurtransferase SseA
MSNLLSRWFLIAMASCLLMMQSAMAAEQDRRNLASVEWLAKNLGREDVVLLDASPAKVYAAKHVPGAVNIDVYSFGGREVPLAEMERRIQSWGVSPGKKVVVYDQGGTMTATSLFFDLYYYGFPPEDLFVLDGGLFKWQAAGGTVTKDVTPAAQGSFRVTRSKEDVRARLPEFLVASGDPANNALVEALDSSYHYGATKFFDRAGHVPNAISLPLEDFYNADKTFKSPAEIQKMLNYMGIKPGQRIHAHCGGGIAASVPFFAIKFLADYPKVKLYKESQFEWLRDDRGLPFWTYAAPAMKRDKGWLDGWGGQMMRMFGMAKISVIDVRPADAYKLGHVPYALNIPAEVFRRHLDSPGKLAEILGAAGVDASHEAVIISDSGLNANSALAYLALEKIGQKKVSVLMDSVDDWALAGFTLTKEATVVGARKSPQDMAVPATSYPVALRSGITINELAKTTGLYPKIFIASGKTLPAKILDGKVIHLPHADLLNADGTPKAAKDIWSLLNKAGVPRYAEIICIADDPGEAAANFFILKLMGYPDVKVLVA